MKSASISAMQRAVINYIQASVPKDTNKAQVGTYLNDYVVVGRKRYRANLVNDMYLNNGDSVVCLLPDSGNFAAVVGKS